MSTINKSVIIIIIIIITIIIINVGQIQFYFLKQPFANNLQNRCLKNFAIFTRKNLCRSLFLITLQVFRPETLSKRGSNTGAFL